MISFMKIISEIEPLPFECPVSAAEIFLCPGGARAVEAVRIAGAPVRSDLDAAAAGYTGVRNFL